MTDRELMQQALDALEWCYDVTEWPANGKSAQDKAIEALRARLAQPEPEELGEIVPANEEQLKRIAKLVEPDDGYCQACDGNHCTAKDGCVARDNPPPQREWQGLTDEEIEDACWTEVDQRLRSFARAIEAKLREKNT